MAGMTVTEPLLRLFRERRFMHAVWRGERLQVGQRISVPEGCRLEPYAQMFLGVFFPEAMGAFTYSHSSLDTRLQVGRYGSIGVGVSWMGEPHPADWASTSPFSYGPEPLQGIMRYYADRPPPGGLTRRSFSLPDQSIRIGHDVWIGDQAMIAPDVTVGHGAIIGARSLVLDDVPPYAVMVGSPARILRMRFAEDLVERFLKAEWWRFGPDVLQDLPVEEPARFLDAFEARVAKDAPAPFAPEPITFAEIEAVAGAL